MARPRQAMWYISTAEETEELRPHHIQSYGNPESSRPGRRSICGALSGRPATARGLVDFAELLLRAHELWLNKPHILSSTIVSVSTNILVDEFQDTNNIQYAWIRLLAEGDTAGIKWDDRWR